jgi:hypothetical protein
MTDPTNRYARRSSVAATWLAAAGCALAPASAQETREDRVPVDARRCMAIEAPAERLACFEAQVDEATRERADDPAPSSSPAAAAPRSSAPPAAPRQETIRMPQSAQAQTEWVGTIASLEERVPNRYVITLDTGTVWEQRVAQRFPLRVGQRVRIYDTRWGSDQRLEAEGRNGHIQVARVR